MTSYQAHRAQRRTARAGMNPVKTEKIELRRWRPRARGDGPLAEARIRLKEVVSPRTRGWTRSLLSRNQATYGGPAHAGMDPTLVFLRWLGTVRRPVLAGMNTCDNGCGNAFRSRELPFQ